jgi:hypothetical protein
VQVAAPFALGAFAAHRRLVGSYHWATRLGPIHCRGELGHLGDTDPKNPLAAEALDAIGAFLAQRLKAAAGVEALL